MSENRRTDVGIFILGFTATITQVALLREFMSVFHGSGIVIGINLSAWMLLTGLGSFFGRFFSSKSAHSSFTAYMHLVLALIPLLTALGIRFARVLFFEPGLMTDIFLLLTLAFAALLPFCIVSGLMFTSYCILMNKASKGISRTYYIDTFGGVAGGLVLSFLLIEYLSSVQILVLLTLPNILYSILFLVRDRLHKILAMVMTVPIPVILALSGLDAYTAGMLYPGQNLILTKNSKYGRIDITQSADQKNYYENMSSLFSDAKSRQKEESVHFAMSIHPDPRKILLLSGYLPGLFRETEKYSPEEIVFAEMNDELIGQFTVGQDYGRFSRLKVVNVDPYLYLYSGEKKFDIIILAMPDPVNTNINRFYSVEFMENVKNSLEPGGIFSCSILPGSNYLGEEAAVLLSSIYNTSRSVFDHVKIIPGSRNYLLCSDHEIYPAIGDSIHSKGIETQYVNAARIDRFSLMFRTDQLMARIDSTAPLNRNFRPIANYLNIRYKLSFFDYSWFWLLLLPAMLFIFFIMRLRVVTINMFTAGFASSTAEIILLFGLQAVYGYVYHLAGIIIAVFMGGIAGGAWAGSMAHKRNRRQFFISNQVIIAFFSFIIPLALIYASGSKHAGTVVIPMSIILVLLISFSTGLQFSLGAALQRSAIRIDKANGSLAKPASDIYGADMAGGALGALLVAAVMLPLLGVINVGIICAALALISLVIYLLSRH